MAKQLSPGFAVLAKGCPLFSAVLPDEGAWYSRLILLLPLVRVSRINSPDLFSRSPEPTSGKIHVCPPGQGFMVAIQCHGYPLS